MFVAAVVTSVACGAAAPAAHAGTGTACEPIGGRSAGAEWALRRAGKQITWQGAGAGGACKSARAAWRRCGSIAFTPNSDDGVANIRARRVGCRTARRVARAAEPTSVIDGPFEYRARGFTCRGRGEDVVLPMVKWTCKRKQARVRFVMS